MMITCYLQTKTTHMYSEIFNGDYTIQVGANQAENDALIKKAPQHAMWFHLKDFPSAHAVVVNTAKAGAYDADIIRRAAMLVKHRAAPGVRSLQNVGVNYLPAKYVRRTETPGKVIMLKAAKCIQV
jgi:predicted ribosome quality control (RQC) complex YloA/Tae2 family protein